MTLFNMLSRLVITFLPRSKRLLISWLQSPSAVKEAGILGSQKLGLKRGDVDFGGMVCLNHGTDFGLWFLIY